MEARISPAEAPYSPETAEKLEKIMPPGIPPLTLFTTLARDGRLFRRFMGGGLLDPGHLTLRQREIVILRVCALSGSEYEWGVHVAFFAEKAGFEAAHLRSLTHGAATDDCWSDDERHLIAACDALHARCTLDDGVWDGLRQTHSPEGVMEILMLAGFYRTVGYLTNVLRLPCEAYAPGFADYRD